MFHTFEGFQNPHPRPTNARSQSRDGQGTSGRRSSTVRACEQCRRRKIRCDGETPCEACQWYKKADLCQYSDPRPSRRHVEKLSSALDEYRNVVEKLFPSMPIESLTSLPRDKLLEMISEARPPPPQRAPSPPVISPVVENHPPPLSPEDENLESLQTMPEESGDSRESSSPDLVAGVSDDVNALSLSSKQPSTYLGISSVLAVMRVILWIAPNSASYFSRTPDRQSRVKREYSFSSSEKSSWQSQFNRPSTMPSGQQQQQPVRSNSLQLINAYFAYFHSFIPLLDETSFRETFRTGKRNDGRWLALLNMVFALGSIAAYTADDTSHEMYYRRARQHLNFDSLGSAHLETVQTLALMGGYYLHYVSQPNLSNAIMGAALRMATTLGLHREFIDNRGGSPKQNASLDLRRRVWWSLFCLDTWGYMTLGRPSMGRWGQGITAKFPQYSGDRENALGILPLVENSRFCKIATQVGDALAASPLVNYTEMTSLDNQLVEWYNNLPPLLKMHEPCPDTVSTTRTIMRWRYQSMRILLHRPVLLSYAMRRIPYVAIRAEERVAIEKCRQVADETIRDISSATRLNQMSGWNAVWLIFQATLVPLLGLFIADNTAVDATASIDSCRTQVEIAMIALARMQSWSPTSKRTLEVVSRMLEASRRSPEDTSTPSSRDRATSSSTQSVGAAGTPAPGMQGNNTGSFSYQPVDPMNAMIPLTEDASQNMWDYLTWSDSNLWAGIGGDPALRQEGLAVYGADEEFLKHHDPMAVTGGMYETGYIPSDTITFQ